METFISMPVTLFIVSGKRDVFMNYFIKSVIFWFSVDTANSVSLQGFNEEKKIDFEG